MIMNENKKTTVTSGPYTFQITDNTLFSRTNNEMYGRKFTIGGTYQDCVEISIIYEKNNPHDARMRFLHNDGQECSISNCHMYNMIKTLLHYVYVQLPTLTHIIFDDKSYIEYAGKDDDDKPTLQPMMHDDPIPLYYFSIAFNGQTWYEYYFNAKQKNQVRHGQYRTRIAKFLYNHEYKTKIQFGRFVSLFNKREEEMAELIEYYNHANNFNDFFQSIQEQDRCRLVGPWIQQFMKYILKDVFYSEDWIIHFPLEITGENNETRKYYYPEEMHITNNFQSKNICLSPDDI
jgi:hypothetical protein